MRSDDIEKWSEFVYQHTHGNIFQSPEYYRLNLHGKHYEPLVLTIERKGNLKAVLLAVIQKEHSGVMGRFSARSIISGGPLVADNDPEYLAQILEKYLYTIKKKVIYTQFRNLWDYSQYKNVFEKYGFNYDPHLDILIDLRKLDKLEKGISKNKRRNIIKSTNKGLLFKEVSCENEFKKCIDLVIATYKKISLPCVSRDYFAYAFKEFVPLNMLRVFGAFMNGQLIGTRMELLYKNLIYDWYAGTDDNESNKYPNDFLIYNILIWGNANGFTCFDFGGAGKPNIPYGVREHKLKFSNNLVEFGRFEFIHNTVLFDIGRVGLALYKRIHAI